MITRVEVERFSVVASKPFDEIVAGLNTAIGHRDMTEILEVNSLGTVCRRTRKRYSEICRQSRADVIC